jgi:hypothetical protein
MFLVGLDTGQHCGCRILHDVSLGTVTMQIRAGRVPADVGRDDPATFMLTGPDVDALIDFLAGVRRQIADSEAEAGKIIQLHREKESEHA